MHRNPAKKTPLVQAILSGDQAAIMRQPNMGDYVNQEDPAYGLSPLCWASLAGNDRAASLLLERGADLSWRDKDGNTPLHQAALFCQPRIVRLLLEHGADRSARNKAGSTPLGLCAAMLQWKRDPAAKLGPELPAEPELRRNLRETLVVLTPPGGSLSFSSWFDRVSARHREFLVSNDFLIRVNGHPLHLFDQEMFDHLWFLWLLLWLVGGVALAVRVGLPPSGKFLWWIPLLTLVPQAFMGTALGPML